MYFGGCAYFLRDQIAKEMKKITIILLLAGAMGVFLYLSKRKENKSLASPDSPELNKANNNINVTRGKRNNNPFNIRYNSSNNWIGQIGSDGEFCIFDTMSHGIRAGGVLLRNYLKQGTNTITKIISKFAPASDGNNTEKYINDVAAASGYDKNRVLAVGDLWRIAAPMMKIESGYIATEKDKQYFNSI